MRFKVIDALRTAVLAISVIVAITSCAVSRGSLNSYIDPTYQSGNIRKVAVFSIANSGRAPAEAREVNAKVTRALSELNPGIEFIAPTEALRRINDANAAQVWARFVEDFNTSGIANKQYLAEIGKALGVDALVQGQIARIAQQDGDAWAIKGSTRITVSYTLIEIASGKLVWEASADGVRINGSASAEAPPVVEAINLAVDKLCENLPKL